MGLCLIFRVLFVFFCIFHLFYSEYTLLFKREKADLELNLNIEKWDESLWAGPNERLKKTLCLFLI